jgi:hypothetical protein
VARSSVPVSVTIASSPCRSIEISSPQGISDVSVPLGVTRNPRFPRVRRGQQRPSDEITRTGEPGSR